MREAQKTDKPSRYPKGDAQDLRKLVLLAAAHNAADLRDVKRRQLRAERADARRLAAAQQAEARLARLPLDAIKQAEHREEMSKQFRTTLEVLAGQIVVANYRRDVKGAKNGARILKSIAKLAGRYLTPHEIDDEIAKGVARANEAINPKGATNETKDTTDKVEGEAGTVGAATDQP
jgi:hypothetical protein